MSDLEAKPFLQDESDDGNDVENIRLDRETFKRPSQQICSRRRLVVLTIIVFELIQIASFYYIIQMMGKNQSNLQGNHYTPATDILSFEDRNIWEMEGTAAFNGPPGLEMDSAWAELEAGTLIKVSDEDLMEANRSSIPLRGGGWAAALGVSHNIHCLKRLNKMVHMDYYYPNATDERRKELIHHANHCVDALRRNLLCYADTTLITLNWEHTITGRPGIQADETQRCVNWDSLHTWMVDNGAKAADMIRPDGSLFDESSLVDN